MQPILQSNEIFDASNNVVCKTCLSDNCKVHCKECGEDYRYGKHSDSCLTGADLIAPVWVNQTCVICDTASFSYYLKTIRVEDYDNVTKGDFAVELKEMLKDNCNLSEAEFVEILVCDECFV